MIDKINNFFYNQLGTIAVLVVATIIYKSTSIPAFYTLAPAMFLGGLFCFIKDYKKESKG